MRAAATGRHHRHPAAQRLDRDQTERLDGARHQQNAGARDRRREADAVLIVVDPHTRGQTRANDVPVQFRCQRASAYHVKVEIGSPRRYRRKGREREVWPFEGAERADPQDSFTAAGVLRLRSNTEQALIDSIGDDIDGQGEFRKRSSDHLLTATTLSEPKSARRTRHRMAGVRVMTEKGPVCSVSTTGTPNSCLSSTAAAPSSSAVCA